MASLGCSPGDLEREALCRNTSAATHLKLVSIGIIFVTSAVGVCLPVVLARRFHGKSTNASALLLIKCFAAGVILSTSLVHVLPDAFEALADCQVASRHPWRDFPFSGFVCLVGALLALFVDVVATSHAAAAADGNPYEPIGAAAGQEKGKPGGATAAVVVELGRHGGHHHGGGFGESEADPIEGDAEERMVRLKQRMVSQVLEIGIIFHSVIIGVTMGMSQNQCTIRPLVAALAFHQIFEGMGLGGCIAQVKETPQTRTTTTTGTLLSLHLPPPHSLASAETFDPFPPVQAPLFQALNNGIGPLKFRLSGSPSGGVFLH